MTFEEAHAQFIQKHLKKRSGERKGRLQRGHHHAEKMFLQNVWWPAYKHFDHLHPEYEVLDWRNRSYYADFAWINGTIKLIIEIKGYGPHVKDMDRQKYCNELNRETFLFAMGFFVISFAYDDVERNPELCKTMLKMVMNRFSLEAAPVSRARFAEKEVIRFAIQKARPVKPKDVQQHFQIDQRTAVSMLRSLCDKGWFEPIYGPSRARAVSYELKRNVLDYLD